MRKPTIILYVEGIIGAFGMFALTLIAFVIAYQEAPENHGYRMEDIEALNTYLAEGDAPVQKYKFSTLADIDALFVEPYRRDAK